MEQLVTSRPQDFPDLPSVVKYGIFNSLVKDKKSARVSMPAQVVSKRDETTGADQYVWRTNLLASKDYWNEWFQGLTEIFLGIKTKKMLVLAGSDRLDTPLYEACEMGKYYMSVIPDCGHIIQED